MSDEVEDEDEKEEGYSWIVQTPTEVYETGLRMEFGIDAQLLINMGGVYNIKMCAANVALAGNGVRPAVSRIAIGGPLYGEDEAVLGFKGEWSDLRTKLHQIVVAAEGISGVQQTTGNNSTNVAANITGNRSRSATVSNNSNAGNVKITARSSI